MRSITRSDGESVGAEHHLGRRSGVRKRALNSSTKSPRYARSVGSPPKSRLLAPLPAAVSQRSGMLLTMHGGAFSWRGRSKMGSSDYICRSTEIHIIGGSTRPNVQRGDRSPPPVAGKCHSTDGQRGADCVPTTTVPLRTLPRSPERSLPSLRHRPQPRCSPRPSRSPRIHRVRRRPRTHRRTSSAVRRSLAQRSTASRSLRVPCSSCGSGVISTNRRRAAPRRGGAGGEGASGARVPTRRWAPRGPGSVADAGSWPRALRRAGARGRGRW